MIGYDLKPLDGYECIVGDMTDRHDIRAAMEGIDAVVHLAAYPNDGDFETKLLMPNVLGLINTLHAAADAKVKRMVLASSVQVLNGFRRSGLNRPITVADGVLPNNDYGLAKVWMEQAGEMYARLYGMTVFAVRIGWFLRDLSEKQRMIDHRAQDIYVSHEDMGRIFAATVECDDLPVDPKFAVLFGYSKDGAKVVDLPETMRLVGYEPRDVFPEGSKWPVEV